MSADLLFGRLGADTLSGRTGDDALGGGFGRDTFVFAKGDGQDIVTDYTDGQDTIDLTAFDFAGFARAASHITTAGTGVIFTAGLTTLLIENFTLAQLTHGDLLL